MLYSNIRLIFTLYLISNNHKKRLKMNNLNDLDLQIEMMELALAAYTSDFMRKTQAEKIAKVREIMAFENYIIGISRCEGHEGGKKYYEEFEITGWDNAVMIYNAYKKIGHNLLANRVTIFLNNENQTKVKSCKFTY